jgi:hypothetical protein
MSEEGRWRHEAEVGVAPHGALSEHHMIVACAPRHGVADEGGSTVVATRGCEATHPAAAPIPQLGLASSSTTLCGRGAKSGGGVADLVAGGGLRRRRG